MLDALKNTTFYVFYLRLKCLFLDDNQVVSFLLKKAHFLDKLNQENKKISYAKKGVEVYLEEISRRKILINDSLNWSIDVLNKSKFNYKEEKIPRDAKGPTLEYLDFISLDKIIKSRRSIRNWSVEEVNEKVVLEALNCAQWAPSSCNRQPWYYLVLTKKNDFNILNKITNQSFFEKANKIIIAFFNTKLYNDSEKSYAFLDMGASIQNLLLALHSLNIGACLFGIKQTRENEIYFKEINNKFNLPPSLKPIAFVALGKSGFFPQSPGRKNIYEFSKSI